MTSFHVDLSRWHELCDPTRCPVCRSADMPADMLDIAELSFSWLSAGPVECLRGACHIIAKKHAIELYELDDTGLLGLFSEVGRYARALKIVTGAVKINYEIHGNTLPHLHIHLYPRSLDDPFPNRPIDYTRKIRQYTAGEFETFVARMREEI